MGHLSENIAGLGAIFSQWAPFIFRIGKSQEHLGLLWWPGGAWQATVHGVIKKRVGHNLATKQQQQEQV